MRALFFILGSVSLVLGVLGIFLPLLPTTPFLLLASACYARSSRRFHSWLLNNRVFGEYIRNYTEHRALPLRTKITALAVMWGVITVAVILFVENIYLRSLCIVIATAVTVHLLRLKTLNSSSLSSLQGRVDVDSRNDYE